MVTAVSQQKTTIWQKRDESEEHWW